MIYIKSFGKVKVLNGIHLEYHPGKIYGLVGENGAGKTTLFNCIMGIYDYTGSITKSKTLKNRLSVCIQLLLFPNHGSWTLGILYEGQRSAGQYTHHSTFKWNFPTAPWQVCCRNILPEWKRNWDLWHYCCKTMTYLFLTSRSMGWTWRDVSWWKDSSGNWKQKKRRW